MKFPPVALIILGFLAHLVTPVKAANLLVRVYSDRGRPVEGALASVQRTVATAAPYSTYQVLTDAKGRFSLDVPDTATYSVCVGSWNDRLLNSCEWAFDQSLVKIATGQAAASITIILQTGAILPIRLNDPQNLLPAPGLAVNTSPAVRFGAWSSDGRYHAAIQTSGDALGQNHQMLVPLSAAVQVEVQATGVQVLDQTGNATAGAPSINFQSSPIAIFQGLLFTVAKSGN
jgi:hypothetical protein